ncbi:MAG: hypothetical protein AAE985_03795 [Thermoplasmataceae archaeon]|jgi:hypothetical protein
MNISELLGCNVTVWLLGQGQENLIPGQRFEGVLVGIDQGAYIFSVPSEKSEEFIILPVGICRVHARRKS